MRKTAEKRYVLGLDLGVGSIGWIITELDTRNLLVGIQDVGSHVFDPGVDGDIEKGSDKSRGTKRREARMPRKMIERRQRRRQKILRLLQKKKLLPDGDTSNPGAIHEYMLAVDAELRKTYPVKNNRVATHLMPYRLRADALDRRLEPIELGRAFYHLAQRRGFLSNRKAVQKDKEDGVVKKGISELQSHMEDSEARTLGEYFAGLDPEQQRIRNRWTARKMYIDEFNAIWEAQHSHHPDILTDDLRKTLYQAIFFQRPLKLQRHLIGRCELEHGARRAAKADRLSQQFRIIQKVNDLIVHPPNGSSRSLTVDEREKLTQALCLSADLTFASIKNKKLLGLHKATTFNLQLDHDEKKLPGHRTDASIRKILGDRWDQYSEQERDEIVLEILSFQNTDALAQRAKRAWGLDEQTAHDLANVRLEQGYAAHSRKALRKLIAEMEKGVSYATARRTLYPEQFEAGEVYDQLPPILKAEPSLKNPTVTRTLTELRKLVNAIIGQYGKPDVVRIELARDMKKSRKQRDIISKNNDSNRKEREKAKSRIFDEMGDANPRRRDIEKVLLADECEWHCPYTKKQICWQTLLGTQPQFDVEHILPFSRTLDNSFVNKTLCYHEENRSRKGNLTPYEAYSGNAERYDEILDRVRRFQGRLARAKLRRFEMEEIPDDFVSRQLNDTRYASRLAADYLGLLYGGRIDENGKQRVQTNTGGITAHLRNAWQLHGILDDGGKKNRDDHRHHAVDAICIALSTPSIVKELQQAAEKATKRGRDGFRAFKEPWVGFEKEVHEKIKAINVSHRLTRRVAGVLHADSNYSKPITTPEGEKRHHIRKPLKGLSITEMTKGKIVDPIARALVEAKWKELGGGKPDKVFADPNSHPTIETGDGRQVPIHKVRVIADVNPWPVGKDERMRLVASKGGSNHHNAIVAVLDDNGQEIKWEEHLVSRIEVYTRRSKGVSIVQRDWGPNKVFKFSLAANEYVVMNDDDGVDQLCRLLSISEGNNEFRVHTDARKASDARKKGSGARICRSAEALRKRKARKVRVTYLGEIIPAND